MIKFKDKRNNIVKEAYSVKELDDKIIIQFTENGKEYPYFKNNIEVLISEFNTKSLPFIVYQFPKLCYKCKNQTKILTYMKFLDGDDLIYPWDKNRLNKEKSLEETLIHMQHPEIEWYPIKIIGSDESLDYLMLQNFPNYIKEEYSSTQNRRYPMNICEKCGAKQGEFFVYQDLNKMIKEMQEIEIYCR